MGKPGKHSRTCSSTASNNNPIGSGRDVAEPTQNRRRRPLPDLNQPALPDLNELPPYDSSDDENEPPLRSIHEGSSTVANTPRAQLEEISSTVAEIPRAQLEGISPWAKWKKIFDFSWMFNKNKKEEDRAR